MALTLLVLAVEQRTVSRGLDFETGSRAFEDRRLAVERGLRALATTSRPPEQILDDWQEARAEAARLADALEVPAVEGLLRRADAAIRLEVDAATTARRGRAPNALAFEALAEIGGLLRAAGHARRNVMLARHRTFTAAMFGLLAIEALLVVLPSARRVAEVETEIERAGAKLDYLAHHDDLTGLANRRGLEARLDAMAAAADGGFGVVLCDLDGFKPINDVYGHEAGDAVLRAVAGRLRHDLRPEDLAARIGGDEFVVVIAAIVDMAGLVAVAERIRERLAQPVAFGAHRLHFAASFGAALFPTHGTSSHALLGAADAAMYEAKQAGGMAVRGYSARLRERDRLRHELVADLEAAIADDDLSLAFQPQIELATGRLAGFEALCRWPSRHRGAVPPDVFIPIAESAGLLSPLTRWVIAEIGRLLGDWRASGLSPGLVGINLTAQALVRDDVLADLVGLAGDSADGSTGLGVEIGENALLGRHAASVAAQLAALSARGVPIAIDDFGNPDASLGRLARTPFDRVKLAGGLMAELDARASVAPVVGTIIEFAHRLGGRVVATRVETATQREFLRRHGCDLAQGYHFAPPLSVAETRAWLGRQPAAEPRGPVAGAAATAT